MRFTAVSALVLAVEEAVCVCGRRTSGGFRGAWCSMVACLSFKMNLQGLRGNSVSLEAIQSRIGLEMRKGGPRVLTSRPLVC